MKTTANKLKVEFKPIDLNLHQNTCVDFIKDATICSFGDLKPLYGEDGKGVERYLQVLKKRMAELPGSCMHAWQDQQIIGQIMLGRWKKKSTIGYVNNFYLIPEYRGKGLGECLENYALDFFKQLDIYLVRLSCSPTNLQAIRFYWRRGWIDLGIRDDYPEVHYFEKKIE